MTEGRFAEIVAPVGRRLSQRNTGYRILDDSAAAAPVTTG